MTEPHIQDHDDQIDTARDSQEPEDPSPTQGVRHDPAQDWPNRRSTHTDRTKEPDIPASLFRSRDVAYAATTDSDDRRTTRGLHASE